MLNKFSRYQIGLRMEMLFPTNLGGFCSCGCGNRLVGKKRKWHSDECKKYALNLFYIVKGDNAVIRENLANRDGGFCFECGVYDEKWQADHIWPVFKGGGACSLDNFQTLCSACHSEKSFILDRIPDRSYVFATSFNILPSSGNASRAISNRICENIIRDTVTVFNTSVG